MAKARRETTFTEGMQGMLSYEGVLEKSHSALFVHVHIIDILKVRAFQNALLEKGDERTVN